ncbi:MAG: RHS repeat-associated core domain-containing protein, partial [Akkermansia sp.]
MVYYNYRHYNPTDGRWIVRDPIEESAGFNVYCFIENTLMIDWLGLDIIPSKEECQRRLEKEAQRQLEKGLGKACEKANGSNNPEACKQAAKAIMDALKDCAGVPKEGEKLPPGVEKKKDSNG